MGRGDEKDHERERMFEKILIANRGEIACRVIRTARKMGIKTVAVYSDADALAPHVQMADEAVRLGPPPASESYLLADAIIQACKATGAQAVHPGYGFLSERESFAKALKEAGIAFIGPPANAIAAMGDKIESKKLAKAAGVNVVPGFLGEIATTEDAVKIASDIGYPVMMKASAGGGGKGMRLAWSEQDVREGFEATKREGLASFGDDRVFIEKFIESPRHIEIQVLGDQHGNIVYLGERECSIQRRHQKVVEEAPSPFVTPEMRKAMGEQAVALARAVGYYSAGTVELIVSGADKTGQGFYFLEMNTRLQVEHPVTEEITGLDLVEQMIRVAAGEKLQLSQKDIALTGWAVESRVYAEDPFRNFLPSIGRLVKYRPPQESSADGITVRNDTGVQEGGEISIFYDPMIAKLVTHGPSRTAAIEAQSTALDAFYVDGIRHNIPFLSALMNHPRWREGKLSTGFIAEEFPKGFSAPAPQGEIARRLAAVGAAVDHVLGERKRQISGQMNGRPVRRETRRAVWLNRDEIVLDIAREDGGIAVRFVGADGTVGKPHLLKSSWAPGEPVWQGTIDGAAIAVQARPIANGIRLAHQGVEVPVYVFTETEAASARIMPVVTASDTGKKLLCPMPGLVVSIAVSEGQEVKAGETLAVVEAMKMQNVLRAERDGTVKKIHAAPGATLAVDALILEFA